MLGSQVVATVTGQPDVGLVAAFVRAGALVFGGGHVVLPLLDAGVVPPGWVTENEFLAGYGAAQALPGSAVLVRRVPRGGRVGGTRRVPGGRSRRSRSSCPAPCSCSPRSRRSRGSAGGPAVAAALAGANAAVVGILAAALITPVGTGALTSTLAVVVAAAGAAVLLSGRVPPLAVVAGSAAVMALIGALTAGST